MPPMPGAPQRACFTPTFTDRAFKAALEQRFGSDEALGVRFEIAGTGEIVEPAVRDRLGPEVESWSVFPDGSSAVICTNYAEQVCIAYPGRARIMGFPGETNPMARMIRERLCFGHDFAILNERYIVDGWLRLEYGDAQQIVFDLLDPADQPLIADLYGDRQAWVMVRTGSVDRLAA